MNPLLLLALFGGGAIAYVKSKKNSSIAYPSDSSDTSSTTTSTTTTKRTIPASQVAPVPWMQPDYDLKSFTRSTWNGIRYLENGASIVYGGGDVMKAPLLAATEFIQTRDARSGEISNGVLTVSEEVFDAFLANQGFDGNSDSRKFKSEVFVLVAQIDPNISEFRVNLRNGGVAIAKKVFDDQVRKIITASNASSVVTALPNESVLNNNVGIRVPFAAFRNKSVAVPDGAYQFIVYNTIDGNAIVNVSAPDESGKRTYTPYKTLK